MSYKRVRVDVLQVHMPRGIGTFEALLDGLGRSPNDDSRIEDIGGSPMRLHEYGTSRTQRIGDVAKIRMDQVAVRMKLSGATRPIDLDDDEGLGEETAFLYDIPTRCIAVQRNRSGPSWSAIETYVSRKTGVPISFQPILRPDAQRRLTSMNTFKHVEVSISRVADRNFRQAGLSAGAIGETLADLGGAKVSLVITAGRGGALRRTPLLNFARWFNREHVEKETFRVSGVDDDGANEFVDLVTDRMVLEFMAPRFSLERVNGHMVQRARVLTFSDRIQNMRQVVEEHRRDLQTD